MKIKGVKRLILCHSPLSKIFTILRDTLSLAVFKMLQLTDFCLSAIYD